MLRVLMHLLFGGVFVYAGAVKAWDPAAFLLDIRSFELLPDPWAAWLAIACMSTVAVWLWRRPEQQPGEMEEADD